MNLFSDVKTHINTQEAARQYGLEINRYGKALCPFHNDRHPSLYVADDHYYCYACGEHGDVIDLTARLFDLSLYEAAKKHEILVVPCDDFGVKGYVRIAYCVDLARVKNALPAFRALAEEIL